MSAYFTSPTDVAAVTKALSANINDLDAAVVVAFDKLPTEDNLKRGTVNFAVDTGVVNAYLIALPHTPSGYVDGLEINFRPINTNTGTSGSTVNVNSLGVKSLRSGDGAVVNAGDITIGVPIAARYSTATGYFHLTGNSSVDAAAAAVSATAAASSASSASSSASTATTQASAASSSASSASTSATTATTQASNASTSASNAATSATNAANSASSASTSATTATTQASAASSSATSANSSATSASSSASSASTSASTATTQASNASTSATSAAASLASMNKDGSGGVPGLTLFKINIKNAANTITNFFTNATTAIRTWTFPDKDGTVAMTSDFAAPGDIGGTTPAAGSFTTLSLTSDLTMSGTDGKIFSGASSGRAIWGNSNLSTYQVAYGPTHATNADQLVVVAGSTAVGVYSSTGLAITGTLSAIAGTITDTDASRAYQLKLVGAASGSNTLYLGSFAANGQYITSNAKYHGGWTIDDVALGTVGLNLLPATGTGSQINVQIGAVNTAPSTVASFSSTGLAVIGTMKCTTGAAVGGATPGTGGIAFPATAVAVADANTLDDYEEGTWTPIVGGTATYTTQVGKYTKVGRLVTVSCEIEINVIGTGSTIAILGLPFTSVGDQIAGAVGYWQSIATSVTSLNAIVSPGATNIALYSVTAAAATVSANAIFGNGARVMCCASYIV